MTIGSDIPKTIGVSAMKYALESLPELIGEQDFTDLCIALGIANDVEFAKADGVAPGKYLAGTVRGRVVRHHRDDARRQMRSSAEAKLRFGQSDPNSDLESKGILS